MSTDNIDAAIVQWARRCPHLRGRLRLGYLGPRPGDVTIMATDAPDAGEYIDGARRRRLGVAFALTLPLSGDDDAVNQGSFAAARRWMDWVDGRDAAGDYPDLGPGREVSGLRCKNSAPQIVRWGDNGLAKFQFFAELEYEETA